MRLMFLDYPHVVLETELSQVVPQIVRHFSHQAASIYLPISPLCSVTNILSALFMLRSRVPSSSIDLPDADTSNALYSVPILSYENGYQLTHRVLGEPHLHGRRCQPLFSAVPCVRIRILIHERLAC